MYNNRFDQELRNETRFAKKAFVWIVGALIIIGLVGWVISKATRVADTVVDNAIPNYEDFQEIYNTTQKINSDLATIRDIPDTDSMFTQFSKQAVIAQKRQQMTRWIEEYNAKSKMWNRAMWKSDKLPYQLSTNDFSRYDK